MNLTSTDQPMQSRTMRLGTFGLDAAIVRHIGVLLRFLDHQNSQRWQLVDAPPMDLLVTTPQLRNELPDHLRQSARAIVEYGARDDDTPSPHDLPRHFRSRHLEAVIKGLDAPAQRTAAEALPAAAHASPPPAPVAKTESSQFRLLRWPPAALVRRDPTRTRLAAMLTRAPISVEELAQRSGQSLQACLNFVNALQSVGLIESTRSNPAPIATANPERPRKSLATGLINSLRRHLGLGR